MVHLVVAEQPIAFGSDKIHIMVCLAYTDDVGEVHVSFSFDRKSGLYGSLPVVGDECESFCHADGTDDELSGMAFADMVNRPAVGSLIK